MNGLRSSLASGGPVDPDELLTPEEALLELAVLWEGLRAEAAAPWERQLSDAALALAEPLYTAGSYLTGTERLEWRRATYREKSAMVLRSAKRYLTTP